MMNYDRTRIYKRLIVELKFKMTRKIQLKVDQNKIQNNIFPLVILI
jgi:hypothetical protein